MIRSFVSQQGTCRIDVPVETIPAILQDPSATVWADLAMPTEDEIRRVLTETFHFHKIAVENAIAIEQAPKLEDYGSYVYLVVHGIREGSTPENVATVELDVFLGRNFLVTVHDDESRSIGWARDMLERNPDALSRGAVTLLHAILDAQTEHYGPLLDVFEQRIESIEVDLLASPREQLLTEILRLRHALHGLRRDLTRQTEIVLRLSRRELAHVGADEALHFRDVHDRLRGALEWTEQHQDTLASLVDLYLSITSQRLNEIIKFLTMMGTIMLPLTLIAGIYGMNFEVMPEIKWRYGYPFALGLMAVTAIVLLGFFRHRGWLGKPPRIREAPKPARRTTKRRITRPIARASR